MEEVQGKETSKTYINALKEVKDTISMKQREAASKKTIKKIAKKRC